MSCRKDPIALNVFEWRGPYRLLANQSGANGISGGASVPDSKYLNLLGEDRGLEQRREKLNDCRSRTIPPSVKYCIERIAVAGLFGRIVD